MNRLEAAPAVGTASCYPLFEGHRQLQPVVAPQFKHL
jgi:hypothetical protein